MDSIGAFLRRERELRQVSLEELVQTTRVPLRMLQRIEEDRFEELPGDVFARGFLRSYARALGLDADLLLARFAEGRKAETKTPAPLLATLQTPERGRRFGIAIALVILVILFTLALSIVFNARHRSTPLELSQRDCTDVPVMLASLAGEGTRPARTAREAVGVPPLRDARFARVLLSSLCCSRAYPRASSRA